MDESSFHLFHTGKNQLIVYFPASTVNESCGLPRMNGRLTDAAVETLSAKTARSETVFACFISAAKVLFPGGAAYKWPQ
jgi:hypothetical protein